ncbi:MAG: hypothetical protein K2Q10_14580, partial [Rhodospirillales bacterium]|nr:hypothetical protein [Rhodospirillales bacterium]
MKMAIGIAWTVGLPSGWGVYGQNLALQMRAKGYLPVLLSHPATGAGDALRDALTARAASESASLARLIGSRARDLPYPILHGLADGLEFPDYWGRLHGRPDIGVAFFEHKDIRPEVLERARNLALVVTGSTWNTQVL